MRGGAACIGVVVVAGAAVAVGVEAVGVARVAFQRGLGRLLGAEAGAVALVRLSCGGLSRVDQLLVGDARDETGE